MLSIRLHSGLSLVIYADWNSSLQVFHDVSAIVLQIFCGVHWSLDSEGKFSITSVSDRINALYLAGGEVVCRIVF